MMRKIQSHPARPHFAIHSIRRGSDDLTHAQKRGLVGGKDTQAVLWGLIALAVLIAIIVWLLVSPPMAQ